MLQEMFNQWANTYFIPNKLNQFLRLQQCYDDFSKKMSITMELDRFVEYLQNWCRQMGLEYNPHPMCDDSNHILRGFKGFDEPQEAVYLKTKELPEQSEPAAEQPAATTPQWEIYIRFKDAGYYDGKTNTLADAVRIATGFETLVEIVTLRIDAIEPENPQEAAND